MTMNPRKFPRKESDEDFISNLPDDIICRILSCLPTVDAFRTSFLSKEWEYKWTSVYNIDITDEKRKRLRRKESGVAFVNFMRRITSRTTNVRKLRMCLVRNYKASETGHGYLLYMRNQIQILHLETPTSSTPLVIPGSLLNTTSLRDMVLTGPKFKVPTSNCFTNLTTLLLEYVCICNENSRSDTMVLNFPILETLEIEDCKWYAVKFVEIYAPALIKFKRYCFRFDEYTINIHGDRLAEFTDGGGEPEDIFVTGSKVVRAIFGNLFEKNAEPMRGGLQIQRLLKEFACTLSHLTLSFSVAWAIVKSNQGVSLSSFAKLKRLTLNNPLNEGGNTEVLLELLHAMPCLKCLNLCVMYWDDFDYESVESIPSCIASSLEKIEFVDIVSVPVSVLLLAKFLLETALSLKECHVYDYKDNKNLIDHFVEKISAYPTGSAGVTFRVHNS